MFSLHTNFDLKQFVFLTGISYRTSSEPINPSRACCDAPSQGKKKNAYRWGFDNVVLAYYLQIMSINFCARSPNNSRKKSFEKIRRWLKKKRIQNHLSVIQLKRTANPLSVRNMLKGNHSNCGYNNWLEICLELLKKNEDSIYWLWISISVEKFVYDRHLAPNWGSLTIREVI